MSSRLAFCALTRLHCFLLSSFFCMTDDVCEASGARVRDENDRDGHAHSFSPPPPLRQAMAPMATSEASLSYYCLSTQLPHAERGMIEFALTTSNVQSTATSMKCNFSTLAGISPVDVHACFTHAAAGTTPSSFFVPLVHHPVFTHRCPRFRCHVFDVVCHSCANTDDSGSGSLFMLVPGAPSVPHQSERASLSVRQLQEALSLAMTAHTGVAGSCSQPERGAEESGGRRSPLLSGAATQLHHVVTKFIPPLVLSSLSLGLTITPPAVKLQEAREEGASVSSVAAPPLRLRWSWVEKTAGVKAAPHQTTSGIAASVVKPDRTHLEPLWRHWAAVVTRASADGEDTDELPAQTSDGDDGGGAAECTAYHDPSSVHRRLEAYARRARHAFFHRVGTRCMLTGKQEEVEELMCALLAVLTEAQAQEAYWASPLTPLHLHDPSIVDRCLEVWFVYVGRATRTPLSAMEVPATVRAVMLTPRRSWWDSNGVNVPTQQQQPPLYAQLRDVCEWITMKVLSLVLHWLPSTSSMADESQASASRSAQLFSYKWNETHVLFRGAVDPRYSDGEPPHRVRATAATTPSLQLLDQLLASLTEARCFSDEDPSATQRQDQPAVALTHELFTHPTQHGVVACRLHLGAPLHRVLASSQVTEWQPSTPRTCAARRPVAALLTWYAVDFKDVFSQSYRVWSLIQRGGVAPLAHTSEDAAEHRSHGGRVAPLEQRGVPVDPAVLCCEERNRASAARTSTLGMLGRCLLLALWMKLRLVDTDVDNVHDEEGDAEESVHTMPVCGTLYYSPRRNMLFVRDWGTVQQLHRVLVSTSACSVSDVQRPCVPLFESTSASRASAVVCAAATAVLQAFVRARTAQQQVRERHRQAIVTALHRYAQEDQRKQQQQRRQARRWRAATAVQAWLRARLSRALVCQLDDVQANERRLFPSSCGDSSSVVSTGAELDVSCTEAEEECVLLHWSTVDENGSVASITSSDAAAAILATTTAIATPDTQIQGESMGSDDSLADITPARELAGEASFAASVETIVEDAPAPPFLLAQQSLFFDLEAHERALVWLTELSELLWFTDQFECVGRRACEEEEVNYRRELQRRQREARDKADSQGFQHGSRKARSPCGVQLHNDECVPVAALTLSLPAQTTTSDGAEEDKESLADLMKTVCRGEAGTRADVQTTDERTRQHVYAAHLRRRTKLSLMQSEAQQRRFLGQMWELTRQEWQARWTNVVLPECVLRELHREAFAEDQPGQQQQQVSTVCGTETGTSKTEELGRVVVVTAKPVSATSVSPLKGAPSTRKHRESFTARRAPPTVAEAAKAHRAFLLSEDEVGEKGGDVCAGVKHALPVRSALLRRSASPAPQPTSGGCRGSDEVSPSPIPSTNQLLHKAPLQHVSSDYAVASVTTMPSRTFTKSADVSLKPAQEAKKNARSAGGGGDDGGRSPSARPTPTPTPPRLSAAFTAQPHVSRKSASVRGVPVVSVSLCREEDVSETPLRERPVNPLAFANDVKAAAAVAAAGAAPSPVQRGWWFVPLNRRDDDGAEDGDDGEEEKVSETNAAHATVAQSSSSSNRHSITVFLKRSAGRSPCQSPESKEDREEEKTKTTAETDNVASAVAAAIALARGSAAAEHPPTRKRCTFSRAWHFPASSNCEATTHASVKSPPQEQQQQQQQQQRGASKRGSLDEIPSARIPRKRYVTWADNVQEY